MCQPLRTKQEKEIESQCVSESIMHNRVRGGNRVSVSRPTEENRSPDMDKEFLASQYARSLEGARCEGSRA